jgi:hypothetical protein
MSNQAERFHEFDFQKKNVLLRRAFRSKAVYLVTT